MKLNEILGIVTSKMESDRDIAGSKNRNRYLVYTRNLYFKFAKKYTTRSITDIGRLVNRNHSTVLFGLNSIEDIIHQDVFIREKAKEIDSELRERDLDNKKSMIEIYLTDIEKITTILVNLENNFVNLRDEITNN